jgi:hypothetical protein
LGGGVLAVLVVFLAWCDGAGAPASLRIGFVDPALPGATPKRNAAALAFARTQGEVTRLRLLDGGGFQSPENRTYAPEEFDVLWFHQGEDPAAAALGAAGASDLREYVEGGGVLLLSGAAGRVLNDLLVEPTSLRVLSATDAAYNSGMLVPLAHRDHPAFAGLDTSQPILLTSLGGNALADFYGTEGPHGELLAEGNAGVGERPVVEYAVGQGRIVFVGWRLPDFTTAHDSYRPNLERLFGNLLRYLAGRNTNRARLVVPPDASHYVRLLGVPFLLAAKPFDSNSGWNTARCVVVANSGQAPAGAHQSGPWFLTETPAAGEAPQAQGCGITLSERERPVATYLAARHAEQEAEDRRDREMIGALRVIRPKVSLTPAPLKPLREPAVEQSVLLGRSAFMAPDDGRGDITPMYQPVEDGGFRIVGGKRALNRPIVVGQNRIWTGDTPLFRMDTTTGNGTYSADKICPLWPRPDAQSGSVYPCMGTLRLGVRGEAAKPGWMDELANVETTFRPGYTTYRIADPSGRWKAVVTTAPTLRGHGLICRVEFDRATPLIWQFGGIWWSGSDANTNQVEVADGVARITESNLPNGVVMAGWDGGGTCRSIPASFGAQAEFASTQARKTYHLCAVWGVSALDSRLAAQYLSRLDTPCAAAWPESRDRLKQLWKDCYLEPALEPQRRLRALLDAPNDELERARSWWDRRRSEFQISTPDAHLNALINWERCISEYHRQGPGLVLGCQYWCMYSHISTGWYGKEWGGDHDAMEQCLRLYAAMQREDGSIRWISTSLFPFDAEDNTPYWVDQVWRHYTWTADARFLRDLWPCVRQAVSWLRKHNDPDDDGLFQDSYEYWNCDSNGKGPKAAAPSAMAWAALDRAAKMAEMLGEAAAAKEYQALAKRTQQQIARQLWREKEGRLGSIGADGFWRGHPQTWEEYLPINAGLLTPVQGRRAMRWLEAHYGFEPQPGVRLLACSDWWPIRWSTQWIPTGDTLLAVLAGMKSGDTALWWPYLRTVVMSAFKSDFPGINMGISNFGAGGGDREDVDSVDPHPHAVVRGLFGVEPALHQGRIDLCPAFPADWQAASIRTPDLSYDYRRQGNRATFHIHTPVPLVKRVRANLTGPEVITPAEADSVVTLRLGPLPAQPKRKHQKSEAQILAEQQPVSEADTGAPLRAGDRERQVLFDLAGAFNATSEEMTAAKFVFDYGSTQPIAGWWGNPPLSLPPSPRVVAATNGVLFLTSGRPHAGLGADPKNLLALANWRPYPFPGGAVIPVGLRCERLWLLLQSYVHPMKNYVVNGEIVLRYEGGRREVVSIIPPFNLDCYFQHFSRQGVPVPYGRLGTAGFIHPGMLSPHADSLQITCDPHHELRSVELRATCSEGVLGLAGLTVLRAK